MACQRCQAEVATKKGKWCPECETAFDLWVRRYAADIAWAVVGGGIVMASIGIVLPLLGVYWIAAVFSAVAAPISVYTIYRIGERRRRRQFLAGAPLPRAYLPAPK